MEFPDARVATRVGSAGVPPLRDVARLTLLRGGAIQQGMKLVLTHVYGPGRGRVDEFTDRVVTLGSNREARIASRKRTLSFVASLCPEL